jgi:hypothetical protein
MTITLRNFNLTYQVKVIAIIFIIKNINQKQENGQLKIKPQSPLKKEHQRIIFFYVHRPQTPTQNHDEKSLLYNIHPTSPTFHRK